MQINIGKDKRISSPADAGSQLQLHWGRCIWIYCTSLTATLL